MQADVEVCEGELIRHLVQGQPIPPSLTQTRFSSLTLADVTSYQYGGDGEIPMMTPRPRAVIMSLAL